MLTGIVGPVGTVPVDGARIQPESITGMEITSVSIVLPIPLSRMPPNQTASFQDADVYEHAKGHAE